MQSFFIRLEVDVVVIPSVEVTVGSGTLVGFAGVEKFGCFIFEGKEITAAEGALIIDGLVSILRKNQIVFFFLFRFFFSVRNLDHERALAVAFIFFWVCDDAAEAM